METPSVYTLGPEIKKEEVESYIQVQFPLGIGKKGYCQNVIEFLQQHVCRPIYGTHLNLIPGKTKAEQNHKDRRWRQIRDELHYSFISTNDPRAKGLGLKAEYWVLLEKDPKKPSIRAVSKAITSAVFQRDKNTCTRCGAVAGHPHHLFPTETVRLHLGHIVPFCQESSEKVYKVEDFVTLCSKCNEGEKSSPITKEKRIEMLIKQKEMICLELKTLGYTK